MARTVAPFPRIPGHPPATQPKRAVAWSLSKTHNNAVRFRWTAHEGRRHAIHDEPVKEGLIETLCGDPFVPQELDLWRDKVVWPTCWDCDGIWRETEGIRPWPRKF
ncbi:zinc finger protein [Lentzea sp. NPDC003310]|uniref:zinc finger protein n=1 Tax=Lentzea sp. NPDC003310 TaxID=3154447 RepID=UPI0033A7F0BF